MVSENYKGVKFCRIKELSVGDAFLYMGCWRYVVKIENGKLRHRDLLGTNNHKNIQANSMQFVEVIKSPKPVNNKPL